MRDVVEYALSREGMETEAVSSGEAASARLLSDAAFDLMILDLMLPDTDGVTLCRELRSADCASRDVPVIMLTARDDETSVVVGLEIGADDYVTKPFSVEELLARIRAVTRRTTEPERVEPVQLGRWTVDLSDHVIYENLPANTGASDMQLESHIEEPAQQVHLTPTEWQLLQALVSHPGRLVSQRQLLQQVWGPTYVEQSHYLRQYVKALRHKLEDDPTRPRHLVTEPGMGYRFQP